ncbi:MAG: UvrD-helicase domain-containing protein [Alphaproteobacteria bacterium]|nr:UvrD-helicase domain-containing protein [Alphaproteobacteria bacterium]
MSHSFEDALSEAAVPVSGEPPYLRGLNDPQREAVLTQDGPVLVLAGAGTGKTRVLTTRLAHLLYSRKAYPGQILAVTFTNKAAREMKERIGMLIGGVVEGMQWLGTFHSIGARMLRRHAELVGLKSNFTILDDDDQLRLLKQIISAAGLDEKRHPPRQLLALIDRWKNRGWLPEDVPQGESYGYAAGKGAVFYAAYQHRLKELNAADFGDLLLSTIKILREHPDILEEYRRRFVYMLVDEYQDTNIAQHQWLKLLAGERRNICCVGDDDQSIYAWRGAEVENILKFERDYPGAKIIRLEQNYRSTPEILDAASHIIKENRSRHGKTLHTEAEAGSRVTVLSVWDAEEEAREIGSELETLQRRGERLASAAILVRAAHQMREFEERFVAIGLPYRVIGGPRFYERQEIRDALAYLRVVAQPDDDLAFERIVNKPKRGLGDKAIQDIQSAARRMGISLASAARRLADSDEMTGKARSALRQLMDGFERWRAAMASLPHPDLATLVLEESGYVEMWQADKSIEAEGRLDNLKELIRSMEGFENLIGFLEHVSLVMEAEQNETGDKVSIMTLHGAKGLEFDTVFLPGWEEGLFPSQRSMDESGLAGLEEERRLAYVGITRGKKHVQISHAANRRTHGLWQSALPSRFISELPQNAINLKEGTGYGGAGYGGRSGFTENRWSAGDFSSSYDSPGWRRAQNAAQSGAARSRPPMLEAHATLVAHSDPDPAGYERGDNVLHAKFGRGRVTTVDGNKLTVRFEDGSEKKVLSAFLARA